MQILCFSSKFYLLSLEPISVYSSLWYFCYPCYLSIYYLEYFSKEGQSLSLICWFIQLFIYASMDSWTFCIMWFRIQYYCHFCCSLQFSALVIGSFFQLVPVPFDMPFLSTSLLSGLMLFSLSQPFNQLLLQETLVLLNGEWYLETKILVPCVLVATGMSLVSLLLTGQSWKYSYLSIYLSLYRYVYI